MLPFRAIDLRTPRMIMSDDHVGWSFQCDLHVFKKCHLPTFLKVMRCVHVSFIFGKVQTPLHLAHKMLLRACGGWPLWFRHVLRATFDVSIFRRIPNVILSIYSFVVVLRAATTGIFSISQLPIGPRYNRVSYFFISKQFAASHVLFGHPLFSELAFWPSGTTIPSVQKYTDSRFSYLFARACMLFLLTFFFCYVFWFLLVCFFSKCFYVWFSSIHIAGSSTIRL